MPAGAQQAQFIAAGMPMYTNQQQPQQQQQQLVNAAAYHAQLQHQQQQLQAFAAAGGAIQYPGAGQTVSCFFSFDSFMCVFVIL